MTGLVLWLFNDIKDTATTRTVQNNAKPTFFKKKNLYYLTVCGANRT